MPEAGTKPANGVVANTPVKLEPVNDLSVATLKKLAWALYLIIAAAVMQAVATFLPGLADIIAANLPWFLVAAAPFIKTAFVGAAGWLVKKAETLHLESNDEALKTEPPKEDEAVKPGEPSAEMKKYY